MEFTSEQKKLGLATIATLLGLLTSYKACFEGQTPDPVPSPSPSVSVSATPSVIPSPVVSDHPQKTMVADSFEKPEYVASSTWKVSVTRTILDGQVTSFVLKSTAPCELVSVPGIQKLIAFTTTKASAPSYALGTFYDGMRPLTTSNCADAKYLQLDVSSSVQVGDASITVVKKATKAPALPKVALNVEFNNWPMVRTYCGGNWCQTTPSIETYGLQGTSVLKAHRLSSYKSWPSASFDWQEYVGNFQLGLFYVGWGAPASLGSIPLSTLPRPAWAYVHDEPKYYDYAAIETKLTQWATQAPNVRRMITTSIRLRDTNPSAPTFGKIMDLPSGIKSKVQIYVPVAEAYCVETWKNSGDFYPCRDAYLAAGVEQWMYISNMSHGAEGGSATGSPDIMIDRGAVEEFGFFLLALKYDLPALLYYNSIQNWDVQDVWANPYIFGGNGDGLLMYPDKPTRSALPSLRLKLLREASQWADVIVLAGKQDKAKAMMTNPLTWTRDLAAMEALRVEALSILP